MKRIIFLTTLASLAVLGAQAQDAAPPKITGVKVKVGQVDSPQFKADNVGDRHWKPKSWLEVDVEFDAKVPASAGGRNASVASMVINVYVAFNHAGKTGTQFVKGNFTVVDVPSNEKSHLLAYVSPSMLRRILEKEQFTSAADVKGWGVEILYNNERIAADASPAPVKGQPWWEVPTMELVDGGLLAKRDTPFGILWSDYDVAVKK